MLHPFPSNMFRGLNVAGDPFFATTVLLLSCDGAQGSDTFTDESFAQHGNGDANVGSGNDTHVDTAVKKFGTGSARFDGSGDKIIFLDHDDWTPGAEFTIELSAQFSNLEATVALLSHWNQNTNNRSWVLQYNGGLATNALVFIMSSDGVSNTLTLTENWTPTADTFHHIAVTRAAGVFRMFIDGVMVDKITDSMVFHNSTSNLRISSIFGGSAEVNYMNGYMDEIRINNGHAYYTSDGGFSVPIAAFPRG